MFAIIITNMRTTDLLFHKWKFHVPHICRAESMTDERCMPANSFQFEVQAFEIKANFYSHPTLPPGIRNL